MDKKKVGYWIVTGLVALGMTGGAIGDLVGAEPVMQSLELLGYPAYLATILGVAKLSAVVVLLMPKAARLKEWAYAGLMIDLVGAVISHVAVADAMNAPPPAVFAVLVMVSWWLRPDDRKLQG